MKTQAVRLHFETNRERRDDRSLSVLSLVLAIIIYPLVLTQIKKISHFMPEAKLETNKRVVTLRPDELDEILKKFEAPLPIEVKVVPKAQKKIIPKKKVGVVRKSESRTVSEKALLPTSWVPSKAAEPQAAGHASAQVAQTNLSIAPVPTAGFGFKEPEASRTQNEETALPDLFKIESAEAPVFDDQLVKEKSPEADGLLLKSSNKEFEIRGGMDPEVIKGIVAEHLIELRYCYETLLLKDAQAQGDVMTIWQIDSQGAMASIGYESETLAATDLIPCIDSKMKQWKFPKPDGGGQVHVRYPFRFFR